MFTVMDNIHYLKYERGVPQGEIQNLGETDITGTTIHFVPDSDIFTETTEFDFDTLSNSVTRTAFLNKGIKISIEDKREEGKLNEFHYEGGIKSYVEHLNRSKEVFMKNHFI